MKKLRILLVFLSVIMVLSGCSAKEEKKAEAPKKAVIDKNAVDKTNTAKQDEDMKKEIEKEKGLSSVNLIITEDSGGFVLLDFEVDSSIDKTKAKEIAEKYAKKLRGKYKDYSVDVQARKNGKKLEQVKLDK